MTVQFCWENCLLVLFIFKDKNENGTEKCCGLSSMLFCLLHYIFNCKIFTCYFIKEYDPSTQSCCSFDNDIYKVVNGTDMKCCGFDTKFDVYNNSSKTCCKVGVSE